MSLNAMAQAHINIPGGLDLAMPRMLPVRQRFERHTIHDVAAAVRAEIAATIFSGASIAIGVGSRGVANTGIIVKTLVAT